MVNLDRENMVEDVRGEVFDTLEDWECRAIARLMKTQGYSIGEALDIVLKLRTK